jgi:Mrp family chromosome partitioning ATPase
VRIRSELERRGAISAAIVSATSQEGKTTVLCDLGLALASLSAGREVALVDLDLRKPSLAQVLGIRADTGVEGVLSGKARLNDVRISLERPALDLYPAIEPQHAAHELLALPSFVEMIRELERRYATVLVDTPPTLPVPDTSLMLRHVAVCIPVARSGQTRARLFRRLIEVLPRHQILGELLNDARMPAYQYQYYGYDQHDGGREEDGDSAPPMARQNGTPSQQ